LQWVGDRVIWLADTDGDENYHLYVGDPADGSVTDLTPYPGVQVKVLGRSPSAPGRIAVAMNLDDPACHVPYIVDLGSGALQRLPVSDIALGHLVDGDLGVGVVLRPQPDGSVAVSRTRHGEEIVLVTVGSADAISLFLGRPSLSAAGTEAFMLSSDDADTVGLVALDVTTGERRTCLRDPAFDVAEFRTHPRTGVADLGCIDAERRRWMALDQELTASLAALDSLPGDVRDIRRSDDDLTWVVTSVVDDGPAVYRVLDRRDLSLQVLGADRPALAELDLGSTRSFSFLTSDGLRVHGYVTVPTTGVDAGMPLPAVLWVHGGPWSRDRWGFDPFVQLIATRGYACVQVNFRGSTGYGKSFVDAGDREWGAAMQRDLDEAIDYLAAQGVIDDSRVAIAGGSYGGYATLMGLATRPDRFRCGIAFVAPSNLLTLLRSFPPYWTGLLAQWHQRVGDPDADHDLLWQRSPLAHVDQITAPLLLVHGANDPRVKSSESEALAQAMRARDAVCDYHVIADEGHGVAKPANAVWLLERMADFLAIHLPVSA
jgi:dienelactone hydrolase